MESNYDWNKKFENWEEEKPRWIPFNGYVREPWPMFLLVLLFLISTLNLALWGTWAYFSDDPANEVPDYAITTVQEEPEENNEKIQNQALKNLVILWGFCVGNWTLCGTGYYILCNAPRYPRMASLLIKREFRLF